MRYIFTTSPDLFSMAIRGFDSGGVSHVGMESPLVPGEVIDTTWRHGGVKKWPKAQFETMHQRRVVRVIDVALPDEAGALSWLHDQIGKPYDKSAIFGMAILRNWQNDNSWYCFELAMATALKGGFKLDGHYAEIGGRLCREVLRAWSVSGQGAVQAAATYAQAPGPATA
jgi:uncharacterized protein YycO